MRYLLAELKELENMLENEGYEIDHYEVRERSEPGNEGLNGRSLQRAEGLTPTQAASDWESINAEEYIIEVFMGGETLDRIIYESGKEPETISFSGRKYELDMESMLEVE